MKIIQAKKSLEMLGWKTFKDEVGDQCAHFQLPDRIVQIIFGVDKIRNKQKFESTLSLTTAIFSNACSYVDPDYGDYATYIRAWDGIDIYASEILEEHIRQASDQAVRWAKAQDLEKALYEHAALPTDAPGVQPVWHLGALAVLGDVKTLKAYQISFAAGDRLGFVNYITKDYIDRALALAEQHALDD